MLFRNVMNQTDTHINTSDGTWWEGLLEFGKRKTSSGEDISPEGAFSNIGTVFECVVIRANSISKLPLQLYKRTEKGKEKDKKHNLWYLLEKRPNKWQTPSQFKQYIEVCRCLWGNAYIKLVFDNSGKVVALEPLEPSKVYIIKPHKTKEYLYQYSGDDGLEVFTEDEIIHIPYISLDGKEGKAPLEVARENAGNLQAITKFEGGFYKNSAMTPGILETPSQLNEPAKARVKEEWRRLNGGSSNAGDVAILDAGFNYKPISIPIKDMEFIASRKMNKAEIATIFDVPLYMLNEFDNAKFNNVEHQNLRFLNDVLQPTITLIEEELNYKLFTIPESEIYYVKFNLNSMLRADSKTRAEYYKEMIGTGVMNINKVCDIEDLDNIGEMGDKHFMSLNYTTLDTIEKHNRLKGGDEGEE